MIDPRLSSALLRAPIQLNQLGQPVSTMPQAPQQQPGALPMALMGGNNAFANAPVAPAPPQQQRPTIIGGPQTDALAQALIGDATRSQPRTGFEALGKLAELWSGNRQADKFAKAQSERDAAQKAADRAANLEDYKSQKEIDAQYAGQKGPEVKEVNGRLIAINPDMTTRDITPADLPSGYRAATPEERAAWGVAPGTPLMFGPDGKPSILSSGGTTVNVAGDEKAFEKEYGKGLATAATDISALGDKAASNLQKGTLIRKFMDQVNTGSLAPTIKTVGAWAQSVGIDPSVIGIDPNTPANLQTIEGLSNSMIMGKIGPGGFPANNFSEQDRKFILTTIPQITDLKQAAMIKLEVSNRLDQLAIDRANAWEEAQSKSQETGTSLSDTYRQFEHDWRAKMAKGHLFDDLIPTAVPTQMPSPALSGGGASPTIDPNAVPSGVDPTLWKFMTPEEKKLWQ